MKDFNCSGIYKYNEFMCPPIIEPQNYIYHGFINIYYPSLETIIGAIFIIGLIIIIKKLVSTRNKDNEK